ncbi:MAG: TolC family protein [Geothrix sp.]|uniref:TolC family protein n=1 Tax=Geothrix sp. TaxID=1962974 RepID=UPI00182E780D|nr:TolC family protein [Geothrix sp.]NWJ41365.1 TolC family protein [Geothrix sp.]WIL20648.1 MAG: TolC family protein [Geothrix sp.]
MRTFLLGALPCLLMAQAPPLSYDDILTRARTSPGQDRIEALLAERHRALGGTRGFLREGPSLGLSAGPRTRTAGPSTTDQSVDLDLPLFLSPGIRRRLEASLGQADPALRGASRIEARFHLRQAYLEAWLAERLLHLREADLATVRTWLKAAQARLEAGADAGFQVSLVEGEALRAEADLDEARRQRLNAWVGLRTAAEVPGTPVPLMDPGDPLTLSTDGLQARFEASTLRKAIQSRLDLEEQALRHQEALATSRWSLRGSYAREGEERIGKVGLAYRFSRPGESQALRRETEATLQATRRELEVALLELDARFQSALTRLQVAPPALPFKGFDLSLHAISLRLSEGRERPSEALPIRRLLLEAQAASYRRLQAAHLLSAELQALTAEVNP